MSWVPRIFTPVPTPELKNDEQIFQICYDKTAVKSHVNPVLPKAQAAKCKLDFTDMGERRAARTAIIGCAFRILRTACGAGPTASSERRTTSLWSPLSN